MRPTSRLLALLLAVLALPPAPLLAFAASDGTTAGACGRSCCGAPAPVCPDDQGGLHRQRTCPCSERVPAPPPATPLAPAEASNAAPAPAPALAPTGTVLPPPVLLRPATQVAARRRPPPVRTLLAVRQL